MKMSATAKPVANATRRVQTPAAAPEQQTKKSRGAPTARTATVVAATKWPGPELAPDTSKIDTIVKLMRAKPGASIEQLSKATGWQHHSVRGAISGNVKKKLGLNVASERVKGVRVYRIGK